MSVRRSRSHQKPGSLSQGESAPFWVTSQPNFGVTWPPDSTLGFKLSASNLFGCIIYHISSTHPLIWRFRFLLYLKHAPSFSDFGSSKILNMPPHLAIRIHHLSEKHAPSFGGSGSSTFGDSGSSCTLNWRIHHISTTRSLIGKSGSSYTLIKHVTRTLIRESDSYLKHAPSYGDSGSSCALNTPPHLATPFIMYIQHTPLFGGFIILVSLQHAP